MCSIQRPSDATVGNFKYGKCSLYGILHECSCFIEFIKQVKEERYNARLAEHFIAFLQQVQ